MPPSENADRSAYTVREVAAIFELSPRQVRRLIADGVVAPERADRGKYLFSFADLVVLRSIADLVRAGVPHARVRTAVAALRDQLPEGATLAEATLEPGGKSVVVRTDDAAWEPESGQTVLDLAGDDLPARISEVRSVASAVDRTSAADWYVYADEIEATDPAAAEDAYRRAIEADPGFAEARLNLGRLLHAAGAVRDALDEYIAARDLDPDDATTHYNIGVAAQDLGDLAVAIEAYEHAIAIAPRFADARYNLAALYEEQGEAAMAVQQLKEYRDLVSGA